MSCIHIEMILNFWNLKTPQELNTELPRWPNGKESTCQCRRRKRLGFSPWVGKIPWRRKWQPTPVFLPGESHGQRSLVGSPWGRKESDTTKQLSRHTPMHPELKTVFK